MLDDIELLPSPQTTLVIILGASAYPHAPAFTPSVAFANSAKALRDYFLNIFGVSEGNLLYLFDTDDSPSDLEKSIATFLKSRISNSEKLVHAIKDVIIYFVGHGGFTRSRRYHLFVRHTQEPGPQSSKLEMESFANTVMENSRFLRRTLVLDCCFAGAAVHYQAADIEVALNQTIKAFEEKGLGEGTPAKGTTLLCSSSRDDPSITFPDANYTAFTEALLHVLNNGAPYLPNILTLRSVARLATDYLYKSYQDQVPRPEVHSPDQIEGDVANVPLFPNAAKVIVEKVKDTDRFWRQKDAFGIPDLTSQKLAGETVRPEVHSPDPPPKPHLSFLKRVGPFLALILVCALVIGSIVLYPFITHQNNIFPTPASTRTSSQVTKSVTPTPGLLLTAESGTPAYSDTLNSSSTIKENWQTGDTTNGQCFFSSNGYHVRITKSNLEICHHRGISSYQNVAITVEMVLTSGSGGLLFRDQAIFSKFGAYFFEVGSNGRYKISTFPSPNKILQDWTPSPAIIRGNNSRNTLQVIAFGQLLSFFVNGIFLTRIPDKTFSDGGISFVCFNSGEAVFSNLYVYYE